jgi:hypothetical protein
MLCANWIPKGVLRRMGNERGVTLRSDFLIHWTGRCIQTNYRCLNDTQREQYVDRLLGTLKGGLWMMPTKEEFRLDAGGCLKYNEVPATCFTEIKLSATHKHTQHYGCLGFGFKRSFVIRQCGQPVQYVSRNSPIVRNIASLREKLKKLLSLDVKKMNELIERLDFNICFLKNMTEPPSHSEKFDNFDEGEWRILFMNDDKQQPNVISCVDNMCPVAKVRFGPCDLKILIFPDAGTRKMALRNDEILQWFGRKIPIMATVKECLHF